MPSRAFSVYVPKLHVVWNDLPAHTVLKIVILLPFFKSNHHLETYLFRQYNLSKVFFIFIIGSLFLFITL